MAYEVRQWPDSVQRKEIGGLPLDAAIALLVMLRAMRSEGPRPATYKIKPLKGRLHGISQANMKINKEQIRLLFFVADKQIVVVRAFKKTSPQEEKQAYELALQRKATAQRIIASNIDGLITIN